MSTYEIVDGVYKGPEVLDGWLDLRGTQVTDLENLKTVRGTLDIDGTQVSSLGKLENVGESLYLKDTQVTSLGNLVFVGEWLDLEGTQVSSLGNLETVGANLSLRGTKVRDLGKLEDVGDCTFLPDGTEIGDFKLYKKEAEEFLKETKQEDYPLHMNHENWIVKTRINNYLETLK
jgi:hypothetical protein